MSPLVQAAATTLLKMSQQDTAAKIACEKVLRDAICRHENYACSALATDAEGW